MRTIRVCITSGIGNTIMVFPLVEALKSLGYEVKFLIHPSSENLKHLITGHEYEVGERTDEMAAVPILWWKCISDRVSPNQILAKDLDRKIHHESECNMTIARKLGYSGESPQPKIYGIKPIENDKIIIAPGCTPGKEWNKKRYPYWEELCKKLSQKYELAFLGLREDSLEWMNKLGKNLCGKLSLKDSIDYIAGSKGLLSIDNGLSHASAALGLPTNIIYGPTLLSKNKQLGPKVNIIKKKLKCQPCQMSHRWYKCRNYFCVDIKPDIIIESLKGF